MENSQPVKKVPLRKKRSWFKTVLLILLLAFAVMQFIQPGKNNQDMDMTHDIRTVVSVPDSVYALLVNACYDCHSNHTNYPWYANIQPLGWWLKSHIEDGKKHLNFQEFALVEPSSRFPTTLLRQEHKLDEVKESQETEWMPLKSYAWMHKEAQLNSEQRKMLMDWADAAMSELRAKSDTVPLETPAKD